MTYFYLVVAFCILLLLTRKKKRNAAAIQHIRNKQKQNKEKFIMEELAKQFIDKECIIYTIASNYDNLLGIIKEVNAGGMIVETLSGEREAVNLDFVTRIREYPKNKNGKKKSIFT